jgi:dynein heavy chain 1
VIVESGFISSIVNFDSKTITQKMRDVINADYLSQENFTFETVNRASQACGPLVKWLEAQVNYSSILDRVKPLRDRVVMLEQQAQEQAKKGEELNKTINELEKSIAKYKEDYAILISEAQEIKNEMAKVQNKVDRSIALLRNLSSERMRWELQSKMFQEQMATVLGTYL